MLSLLICIIYFELCCVFYSIYIYALLFHLHTVIAIYINNTYMTHYMFLFFDIFCAYSMFLPHLWLHWVNSEPLLFYFCYVLLYFILQLFCCYVCILYCYSLYTSFAHFAACLG